MPLDIRYSTAHYPEKIARRLRSMNLATWITAAVCACYAIVQFLDSTPGMWKMAIVNVMAATIFAAVPLLHRYGELAGPIGAVLTGYVAIFVLCLLGGTASGMAMYYLIAAALFVVFVGTDRLVLIFVFGMLAALLMIALEAFVPRVTTLASEQKLFFDFIGTAFATSGILIAIVFYALREAARAESKAEHEAERVEVRNRFIRETFGRYLSDDVVATLLESPTGHEIGGEKRKVTMMMADLRGFTSLSERLDPERVVGLLNNYLGSMVTIIKQYGGTVDEFIGDAIFVLFGAPLSKEDDAQRAVACAVQMQLEMASVNERNRVDGLPDLQMGIGIHTGQVVVGNVGSPERMKYGVVGSHVNLAARIQSYTIGGQVLISQATCQDVGCELSIDKKMEFTAKGFELPISVLAIIGIGGSHNLTLQHAEQLLVTLAETIPITYAIVNDRSVTDLPLNGVFTKLSTEAAQVRLEKPIPEYSNLKMNVFDANGRKIDGAIYGKSVCTDMYDSQYLVRFTSLSPEIKSYLCERLKHISEGTVP